MMRDSMMLKLSYVLFVALACLIPVSRTESKELALTRNTSGTSGQGFEQSPAAVPIAGYTYQPALRTKLTMAKKWVSWKIPIDYTRFSGYIGLVDGCKGTSATVTIQVSGKSEQFRLIAGQSPHEARFDFSKGTMTVTVSTSSPCVALINPRLLTPANADGGEAASPRPTAARIKPGTVKSTENDKAKTTDPSEAVTPADTTGSAPPSGRDDGQASSPGSDVAPATASSDNERTSLPLTNCAPKGPTAAAQINDAVDSYHRDEFACARQKLEKILVSLGSKPNTRAVQGIAHLWLANVLIDGRSDIGDINWKAEADDHVAQALALIPKDNPFYASARNLDIKLHGYPKRLHVVRSVAGGSTVRSAILKAFQDSLADSFKTEGWEVTGSTINSDSEPTLSEALASNTSGGSFVVGLHLKGVNEPTSTFHPYEPGGETKKSIFGKYKSQPIPEHYTYTCSASAVVTVDDALQRARLVSQGMSYTYATAPSVYDDTREKAIAGAINGLKNSVGAGGKRSLVTLVDDILKDQESEGSWWYYQVKANHPAIKKDLYRVANTSKRSAGRDLPTTMLLPPKDLSKNQQQYVTDQKPLGEEMAMVTAALNQSMRREMVNSGEVSVCGATELRKAGVLDPTALDAEGALGLAKAIGCTRIIAPEVHEAWYNRSSRDSKVQIGMTVRIVQVASGRSTLLVATGDDIWPGRPAELFVGNERGDSENERPAMIANAAYRAVVRTLKYALPAVGSPPTKPVVTVSDISPTSLRASWKSEDPESGVTGFEYRISDSPADAGDSKGWVATLNSDLTLTDLKLRAGHSYYLCVRARNAVSVKSGDTKTGDVEMWSEVGCSEPFTGPGKSKR